MQNNLKNSEGMLQSADAIASADYARHNRPQLTSEQLNCKAKQRENQRKNHKKIEIQEHLKADMNLEKQIKELEDNPITKDNLKVFIEENNSKSSKAFDIAKNYIDLQNLSGNVVSDKELKEVLNLEVEELKDLSTAEQIKNFKEQLLQQGKTPTQILQTLISKFENEKAVSTWVENWKNFLKLHQFAENKPPTERQAIQNIITQADFTNENAFATSLTEISNCSEISTQTKFEISQKFKGENISTVGAMDSALKHIKSRKNKIEHVIDEKKDEKDTLRSEIGAIEIELEKLPLDDPKRQELEADLNRKKQVLQQTETEISDLEKEKPEEISFALRDGFKAKLNPNGTRTIQIDELNFAIQLPENALFMRRKNMLSINLAFTYKALSELGMDALFSPKLKNGEVPDKQQRIFGNRILKDLGYKTDQILSQSNIHQLEKDLRRLKKRSNTTGMEDLKTLGVWDISNQSVNTNRLDSCLGFIRKNRGRDVGFEEVKKRILVRTS